MLQQVEDWSSEFLCLADIARRQPHAVYAALTHGLVGCWVYLACTLPGVDGVFVKLGEVLRT